MIVACGSAPDPDVSADPPSAARPPAGMAWVIFAADTVVAEVASDPEARYRGLRFRRSLADGSGMVFLFDTPGPQQFTMSDTYIPLDIAFIGSDMAVGEILSMEPLVEGPYTSGVHALFALEVPQGWFAAHGVDVGAPVDIEFGR